MPRPAHRGAALLALLLAALLPSALSTDPSLHPPRLRLLSHPHRRSLFNPTAPEAVRAPWTGPVRELRYRGYNLRVPQTPPRDPNTTQGVSCTWQGCDDDYYLYGCWDYPKKAVVSFDDGPSRWTGELLDVLRDNGMKAVFCYLGMQVEKYPEIVKRTADEGHELCIHSWNHGQMTEMSDEAVVDQLVQTQEAIRNATGGRTAFWFRPPFGSLDIRVKWIAEQLGFKFLFWYSDTEDWRWALGTTEEQVAGALRTYSRDLRPENRTSPIFLAHDMHRGSNLVMPQVKRLAAESGYELVSARECTKLSPAFWNWQPPVWQPATGTHGNYSLFEGRYDGVGGHPNQTGVLASEWVPKVFPQFASMFQDSPVTSTAASTASRTGTLVVLSTAAPAATTRVEAVPTQAVVVSTSTSRPSGAGGRERGTAGLVLAAAGAALGALVL